MTKIEIQVRHCFCCGLSLGSIFVAIYTLFLYLLLLFLAILTLSNSQDYNESYNKCQLEVNNSHLYAKKIEGIVILDSSSYDCSFGLYTNELKIDGEKNRNAVLIVNTIIYSFVVVCSILLIIGIAFYKHFFLLPWIFIMIIEIIRGFISTILIFYFSKSILSRITTGIFFFGLQFFHISLVIIIIAKFQRIYNRNKGVILDIKKPHPLEPHHPSNYPTNYGHSPNQTYYHRPPVGAYNSMYSDYSPSQKDLPHYHPSQRHGYYESEYIPSNNRY